MVDPITMYALDRETRDFLALSRCGLDARLDDMSVARAREARRELYFVFAPRAPKVAKVENGILASPHASVGYRLYWPKRPAARPLPALLFIHGGGWALGDLDSYDAMTRWLCARSGAVVVSLDFRLAPEHKYPAALADIAATLAWLRREGFSRGICAKRIVLCGDGTGGTLAALAAHADRGAAPALAALVLLYPLMTLAAAPRYASRDEYGNGEYFLSVRGIEAEIERYLGPADRRDDPRVSPEFETNLCGLPPTLIVTAGFDPLRDEGEAYATRLRAAGTAVDYHCYESTIHGFLSLGGFLLVGREGLDHVGRWIALRLARFSDTSADYHDDEQASCVSGRKAVQRCFRTQ